MKLKQNNKLFLFIAVFFLYACIIKADITSISPSYSFRTETSVGEHWEIIPQLIVGGDTTTAMREMKRIETMCKRKYKSPLAHHEWLSIKAEIYGNYLNDWESACDIQLLALKVLPFKEDFDWHRCMALMKAHVYEYKFGELHLAYECAVLAYVESCIRKNAISLRDSAIDCIMRSCFSLERYKEALSVALRHQENTFDNYNNYYDNDKKGKGILYYSSALREFVNATNYVINCELELGYLYDAERHLILLDSIVQTHNNRALSSNDSIFKYGEEDFSFFNRVELLLKNNEYERTCNLLENHNLQHYTIDWVFGGRSISDYKEALAFAKSFLLQKKDKEALYYYFDLLNDIQAINKYHPDIARILYDFVMNEKLHDKYSTFTWECLYIAYTALLNSNNEHSLLFAKTIQLIIENDLELYSGVKTKHIWSRWIERVSSIYLVHLKEQFAISSSSERLHIWNNGPYKEWFEELLPRLVCENNDLAINDTILACAYHGVQMAKNILLHSDRCLNQIIYNSSDKQLKEKYNELKDLKSELYQCYEDGSIEIANTLCQRITLTEDEIIQQVNSDNNISSSYPWTINNKYIDDIRQGNIYIDFVRYASSDSKLTYGALIAMRYAEQERGILCLDLFTQEELDQISKNDYYTSNPSLYELVWGKLSILFENINCHNVYFSPIGDLHKIAIEYIPDEKGISISDRYNIYRVTSTKEAITYSPRKNTSSHNLKMALFGDMDYDSDKVVINRDEIGLLPFTHFEVDSIYHNLPNNILCTKYVGKNATESLLKSINTSEIDILHIASHGFYWDRRVKYGANDPISKYIGKRRGDFTIEDMNMARSALLFSPEEKDSKEDGILFANEVSEMNFINLDLVTLSACKSAMGDLSSEGLIGLQRGFKKAGANSLLVSLDDVNDKATYLLMREFYKHLFAGYTKIESLQRAQHYVKNYNNKMYNNPKYWCPFILIDGLD